MRKRTLLAVLTVVVLAAGCYVQYDFNGDKKADQIWVSGGVWHAIGQADPIWTSPPGADWAVAGNYDGDGSWEAAATDGTDWFTSRKAGTINFPFPEASLQPVPVPADYDGDKKTDPAWWSRATATWYIRGRDPIVFGTPGAITNCAFSSEPLSDECYDFLRSDIPMPADYDGDGSADLAVYNPVLGEWRFEATGTTLQLGTTGDVPVVANFDGDTTQDPGVFDPVDGTWEVEDLGIVGVFGDGAEFSGYALPVPADYSGDGVADLSYVMPAGIEGASASWHVQGSPPQTFGDTTDVLLGLLELPPGLWGNFVRIAFLQVCDASDSCPDLLPTRFDYDGDHAADPAWVDDDGKWWFDGASSPLAIGQPGDRPVAGNYRRIGTDDFAVLTAAGEWKLLSTGEVLDVPPPPTNGPADRAWPVPADYDGDGRDEAAWYRDSDATWWIDGQPSVQYGVGGVDQVHGDHDVPVPGDYDGDGTDEIAVYRPTDSTLHIQGVAVPLDNDFPVGIPAPGDYGQLPDGIELVIYDPVTFRWHWEVGGSWEGFGESSPGIPVPARYSVTTGYDRPGVAVPNGSTLEWHMLGQIAVETATTPIGTPTAARPAVIGAMPRLTYLRSCELDPDTCAPVPFDYVGDRAADRVWITADGVWHAEGDATPLWSGPPAGPSTSNVAVPANYDGDAKWEAAVVDLDGNWVTAGAMGTIVFPSPEAGVSSPYDQIPVPADYDGDKKTDPAWYSRATGTWYVRGRDPVVFGQPGPFTTDDCVWTQPALPESCRDFLSADVPVPGDWNGDNMADLAVWNPLNGEWRLHDDPTVVTLGGPGVWPAPADYDGDMVLDPATWGLGTPEWEVDGIGVIGSFADGAYPVPADFTGDRIADPSYVADQWGWPVPNTWKTPGFDPLTIPDDATAANIPPWLVRYIVPMTLLHQCFLTGPDHCGFP